MEKLFRYKVQSKKGEVTTGVATGKNEDELASSLSSDGYVVLSVAKQKEGLSFLSKKISLIEKVNLFRFLATMLRSGLNVSEGVDVIASETQSVRLKKILSDLSYETRKGQSVAKVLEKYPSDFDPVVMALVKVGEESGTLDLSFEYIAHQLMASYDLNQKIKSALAYPMVIIFAMTSIGLYMLIGVLPKIAGAFLKLNIDLPFMSRVVMNLGVFVGEHSLLVILGVVAVFALCGAFFLVPFLRVRLYTIFSKIRVVAKLLDTIDLARYARTLSTLNKRGVPIVSALEITASSVSQPRMKAVVGKLHEEVAKGKMLSELLSEHKKIFPGAFIQTVKAGERTGMLDKVLDEIAAFYESEVERSVKRITTLIEPVLILVIGVAVGAMVVLMIAPIYNVIGGLQSSMQK